ncbi:hypothetical protein ABB37_01854 [Leptomonas pyrrhocoris]|uniref:Uncharacterized protein n=1 Tax=Leptomonas pyrrhocoris TaxID=157538 RepID=A0A0N0DY05_LEPPY|nr:hypothetical protein ABB37_09967 [Leptomonas pyrrhocoris]XP_015651688.1 hypothetical protein ABB37_09967 [Leptomonas pyrrhocoris]XP_015661990.1 hypothetical protein ABB37_01854 [Leptomonas pyrrhocoris]KPA73248.1 hypothetical protein ABB37_09967 [Leptomonas pyrrhocoris]KPA73249.1 hypothetical protein ABB37_09967 [Leptomonas pyrrhocoris]KPA83551.1 hypothetical protein ABB37_01854 [Leptomonas pyrrhocoris]|eukprot:XP_015651687.1 hypothetical protein ABB37_09967 [Leptomonas pyrrhocoris]
MPTPSPFSLTYSWSGEDDGDRLSHRVVCLRLEEEGMERAENLVQSALHTTPLSPTRSTLTNPAAAPWMELTVGDRGVFALCIVANARVLEIHEATGGGTNTKGEATATAPLLTQEAQLADASTNLYAHFLCHGGGGALFPPLHVYRLKLFGRTPRSEVCVAMTCLVLLKEAAVPAPCLATSTDPLVAGEALGHTAGAGGANVVESLLGLQRQLFMIERRVATAFDDVRQRMARLESRVEQLEAPVTEAQTTTDPASTPAHTTSQAFHETKEEEEEERRSA